MYGIGIQWDLESPSFYVPITLKKKENIQIYLSNKKSEKNGTILRQQVETRGEREQKIELYRNTRKKKWRMVTSTL